MDPADRIPGIILTKSGEKYPSCYGRGILFFLLAKLIIGNTKGFIRGKALATADDLTNYSPVSHTHDDRYYTETETNSLLNGKANASHTHTIAQVTNLQTTLNDKADSSHNHSASDIASGTLSVARGGTGRSSLTADYFLRGNGTSAVTLSSVDEVKEALGISSEDSTGLLYVYVGMVPINATIRYTLPQRATGICLIGPDGSAEFFEDECDETRSVSGSGGSSTVSAYNVSVSGTSVYIRGYSSRSGGLGLFIM